MIKDKILTTILSYSDKPIKQYKTRINATNDINCGQDFDVFQGLSLFPSDGKRFA